MPDNETSYRPAPPTSSPVASVGDVVTATAPPAAPAAPPRRVGPYEVLERVGRGGLGDVYRARHAGTGREVALKLLRAGEDATPAERRSFARELASARRLCHPGILPILDDGEHE